MPIPSPKCQIYPVAGETAIKNIVDGTLFAGTGAPTLVDEGAEKAWSIVTGTLLEQAIPSKTINGSVVGAGAAIVIRFKTTADGSGADFMPLIGVKTTAGSITNDSVTITRNGSGSYRGRAQTGLTAIAGSKANNVIHTLVYKVSLDDPALDVGKMWWNTAGRVGTAPNAVSTGANFGTLTVTKAFINCQNSSAFTLLDFAYFDVEPTDADCAAIADDYRAVMPSPSSDPAPTGVVTLGTITPNSTGASVPFTYSAADQTGFEYQLNEMGTIYPITVSPATPTGLTPSTPYTIRVRAANASGEGEWSTSEPFTTAAAVAAITFTGTIPAQLFTNGQAVSVDLAPYFSGTLTPFTFANTGALLTGTGLSITSAGLLTGTATTGSAAGIIVTGTDASLNTAASNAFSVTVNAASVPVSFGGTIPAITGTQNAAITPVNTSTYFAGSLTPFTYSLFSGTLPTGVTLNTSTGVISGTPTVSFSGNIVVRATDSGSNTANSNSIAVTVSAAVGTITLAGLANNTATLWSGLSGISCTVMNEAATSIVVTKAGLTANAGGDVTFNDAAITAGTWYTVVIVSGTNRGIIRIQAT